MANQPTMFLPILFGTNRKKTESIAAANYVERQLKGREGIETKLFLAQDFHFPADDYGPSVLPAFPEWNEAVLRADGLVLVAPEYNHSFPGILKSILDLMDKEYRHRAVGVVPISSGAFGGVRMVESLLPIFKTLGLTPIKPDLNIPKISETFDSSGELRSSAVQKHCDAFIDELIWMASALKRGREKR